MLGLIKSVLLIFLKSLIISLFLQRSLQSHSSFKSGDLKYRTIPIHNPFFILVQFSEIGAVIDKWSTDFACLIVRNHYTTYI